jgi:hypothetical protein
MRPSICIVVGLLWWIGTVGSVDGYETAMVFPMSRVQHVDARNQLVTFTTKDGEMRTLRVAHTVAVERGSFRKGDVVSIEVDLDDQIVKIVRVEGAGPSSARGSRNR